MIKVLIFNAYGMSGMPESVKEMIVDTPFPKSRTGKIIEHLEQYPIATGDLQKQYDSVKKGDVLRLAEDKFVFGDYPYPISCRIVSVDNGRPWTIDDYDGAERVRYLNVRNVDKELNYWEV